MKKSFMLFLTFCSLIAPLVAPGMAAAYIWPPPMSQSYWVHNTGGGWGGQPRTDWGVYVQWPVSLDNHGVQQGGVDQHIDYLASQYLGNYFNTYGAGLQVVDGVVVLWNDPSNPGSLPTLPDSLHDLLTMDHGRVNDLLIFFSGYSTVFVISNPDTSLLPLETGDSTAQCWFNNIIGADYAYNHQVILEDTTQQYTKYVPNEVWPGWDRSVANLKADPSSLLPVFEQAYTTFYTANPDYPATPNPSTWTQYTYYVENDNMQVPEPGAVLLLGFGLMALAGMRRVDRLLFVTTRH